MENITKDKLDKKKKKTWSMSINKDGIDVSIRVEELDNEGYLVCINRYGRKDEKGEYHDDNKKFYSKVNPLENEKGTEEKVADEVPDIMEIFDKWSALLK